MIKDKHGNDLSVRDRVHYQRHINGRMVNYVGEIKSFTGRAAVVKNHIWGDHTTHFGHDLERVDPIHPFARV